MDAVVIVDQGRHCPQNHTHYHHQHLEHIHQRRQSRIIIKIMIHWIISSFISFHHRLWFSLPIFYYHTATSKTITAPASKTHRSLRLVHFVLIFFLFFFSPGKIIIHCYETYDAIDLIAEESSPSSSLSSPSQTSINYHYNKPEPLIVADDLNTKQHHKYPGVTPGFNNHQNVSNLGSDSRFSCRNRTEGYFPDKKFCDIFHYCKNDGSRYTFVCPKGSFYDHQMTICEQIPESWKSSDDCRASSFDLESYQNDGQVFVDNNSEDEDDEEEIIGNSEDAKNSVETVSNHIERILDPSNLMADFLDPPSFVTTTKSSNIESPPATTMKTVETSSYNKTVRKNYEAQLNTLSTTTLIPPSQFVEAITTVVPDASIVTLKSPSRSREYDLLPINHVFQPHPPPPPPRSPLTTPSSVIHQQQNVKHHNNQLNPLNNKMKYEMKIRNSNKSMKINQTTATIIRPLASLSPKQPKHQELHQVNQSNNVFENNINNHHNDINVSILPMEHRDEETIPDMERFFKMLDMSDFDISNILLTPVDHMEDPIFLNNILPIKPHPQKFNLQSNITQVIGLSNSVDSESLANDNNGKFSMGIHKFFKESMPSNYWRNLAKFLKNLNFITIRTTTNSNNNNNKKSGPRLDTNVSFAGNKRGRSDRNEFEISSNAADITSSSSSSSSSTSNKIQQMNKKFDPIKSNQGSGGGEIIDHDNFLMSDHLFTQKIYKNNHLKEDNGQTVTNKINTLLKNKNKIDATINIVAADNFVNGFVEKDDFHRHEKMVSKDKISMFSIPVLVPTNLSHNDYLQQISASILRPIVIPLKEKGKLVPAYVLQFHNDNHHEHNRFKRSLNNNNNEVGTASTTTNGVNKILSNMIIKNNNNNNNNNNNDINNGKKLLHFPIKSNLLANLLPSVFKSKLIKGSKHQPQQQQVQPQQSSSNNLKFATNPLINNAKSLNSMLMFGTSANVLPMYYHKYLNGMAQNNNLDETAYLAYLNQLAANENNQIYDLKDFSNHFLSPYHFTGNPQSVKQQSQQQSFLNEQKLQPKPSSSQTSLYLTQMPNVKQHSANNNNNKTSALPVAPPLPIPYSMQSSYSSFKFPINNSFHDKSIMTMLKSKPMVETQDVKPKKSMMFSKNSSSKTSIPSNANVYVPDEVFEDFKVTKSIDSKISTSTTTAITTSKPSVTHKPRSVEREPNESKSIPAHVDMMDAWNRYNNLLSTSSSTAPPIITTIHPMKTTSTTDTATNKSFHPNMKNMLIINYANGTTLRIAGKKKIDLINNNDINNDKNNGKDYTMSSTVRASMMVAPQLSQLSPNYNRPKNTIEAISITTTKSPFSTKYADESLQGKFDQSNSFSVGEEDDDEEEASSVEVPSASFLPSTSKESLVNYYRLPLIFEVFDPNNDK